MIYWVVEVTYRSLKRKQLLNPESLAFIKLVKSKGRRGVGFFSAVEERVGLQAPFF